MMENNIGSMGGLGQQKNNGDTEQEQKRVNHNQVERTRKKKINAFISEFCALLPKKGSDDNRQSTLEVMEKTVSYIAELKERYEKLVTEKGDPAIVQERHNLRKQIETITMQRNKNASILRNHGISLQTSTEHWKDRQKNKEANPPAPVSEVAASANGCRPSQKRSSRRQNTVSVQLERRAELRKLLQQQQQNQQQLQNVLHNVAHGDPDDVSNSVPDAPVTVPTVFHLPLDQSRILRGDNTTRNTSNRVLTNIPPASATCAAASLFHLPQQTPGSVATGTSEKSDSIIYMSTGTTGMPTSSGIIPRSTVPAGSVVNGNSVIVLCDVPTGQALEANPIATNVGSGVTTNVAEVAGPEALMDHQQMRINGTLTLPVSGALTLPVAVQSSTRSVTIPQGQSSLLCGMGPQLSGAGSVCGGQLLSQNGLQPVIMKCPGNQGLGLGPHAVPSQTVPLNGENRPSAGGLTNSTPGQNSLTVVGNISSSALVSSGSTLFLPTNPGDLTFHAVSPAPQTPCVCMLPSGQLVITQPTPGGQGDEVVAIPGGTAAGQVMQVPALLPSASGGLGQIKKNIESYGA